MTQSRLHFARGRFLGRYQARRRVGALDLAEIEPTVPEHEVELHTHEDAHLLLLLGGTYLSSARGMPDAFRGTALLLNPPGTTHRDRFRGLDGRFFTLSVSAGAWRALAGSRRLPDHALRLGPAALVRACRLRRELGAWDGASPLAVESELEELLDEVSSAERLGTGGGPAWLERARERLQDGWEEAPSIAELARAAGVHPVSLARAFRRRYGCSPGSYLRRCRLERAIELLAAGEATLTEVAARCGYADHAHFTHAFRRAFSLAPSAFRPLSRVSPVQAAGRGS